MIEQVVNMKKRYESLVKQFTQENFEAYFAEFFATHQCVTAVQWAQEDGGVSNIIIGSPYFQLSAGYLKTNPGLDQLLTEDLMFPTWKVDKSYREEYTALYDAVVDIRKLMEAEDVLAHVFGRDVDITATPYNLLVEQWGT